MARARKSAKTLRSPGHRALCAALKAARRHVGLNQAEVAERLGKPQSFVAKYEGGERRLDLIEFLAVVRAIGADPVRIVRTIMRKQN
jgi:transcriptional regulator with XRE-family HTH domain